MRPAAEASIEIRCLRWEELGPEVSVIRAPVSCGYQLSGYGL